MKQLFVILTTAILLASCSTGTKNVSNTDSTSVKIDSTHVDSLHTDTTKVVK